MKYNILGFDQKAVLEVLKVIPSIDGKKDKVLKLDIVDLQILQVVSDFMNRSKIIKYTINDKTYFSIQYKVILDDLPILDIKQQALSDRLSKMVELDVLEKEIVRNQMGSYSVFRMGSRYEHLVYNDTSSEIRLQKYSTTIAEVVNYTPKDYSTNNSSTNNQKKEIYKEIVDTWNNSTKSFAKVHVISEKIKSAINSRIRDGYSVDDIKKAILLCESLPDFYKGGDNGKAWKASFMWLISNTKGNFDSILSGALHNSPSAKRDYDMIINLGDKAYKEAYTPSCDGISLFWNDNINAYCTTNNPEWGVYDGYKPNERPNGATVYCQGVYYNWNSEKKEWKRKPLNHE